MKVTLCLSVPYHTVQPSIKETFICVDAVTAIAAVTGDAARTRTGGGGITIPEMPVPPTEFLLTAVKEFLDRALPRDSTPALSADMPKDSLTVFPSLTTIRLSADADAAISGPGITAVILPAIVIPASKTAMGQARFSRPAPFYFTGFRYS